MAIDISSLLNAIDRLAEGLERAASEPEDAIVRDGLIQRFEFTYDLSHKMLRRVMDQAAADPGEIDRFGFPSLIRVVTEQGLVEQGWPKWQDFREMRNITSHTCDEAKAKTVALAIPLFLQEVEAVAVRLQRAITAS